jgi:hypothetical protein
MRRDSGHTGCGGPHTRKQKRPAGLLLTGNPFPAAMLSPARCFSTDTDARHTVHSGAVVPINALRARHAAVQARCAAGHPRSSSTGRTGQTAAVQAPCPPAGHTGAGGGGATRSTQAPRRPGAQGTTNCDTSHKGSKVLQSWSCQTQKETTQGTRWHRVAPATHHKRTRVVLPQHAPAADRQAGTHYRPG